MCEADDAVKHRLGTSCCKAWTVSALACIRSKSFATRLALTGRLRKLDSDWCCEANWNVAVQVLDHPHCHVCISEAHHDSSVRLSGCWEHLDRCDWPVLAE